MKDEIKEILEALKPHDEEFTKAGIKEYPLVLSVKEQKTLLYHINNLQDTLKDREEYCYGLETQLTNLQEENKRLKENAEHNDKVVDKARWSEMIYKSRNEKAIEHIEESLYILKGDSDIPILTGNVRNRYLKPVLNILQGSDKE